MNDLMPYVAGLKRQLKMEQQRCDMLLNVVLVLSVMVMALMILLMLALDIV